MKKLFLYFSFVFLFSFSNNVFAQTQAEMNQTAIESFKKADDKLNQVYKSLMKKLTAKEKTLLITAQKNWIKYRDSKCDFEKEEYNGGSIQPSIYYSCLAECTEERAKDLKTNFDDRNGRYN